MKPPARFDLDQNQLFSRKARWATVRASIAQRLLVLFWHRVERLQQQPPKQPFRRDRRPAIPGIKLGKCHPYRADLDLCS